MSVAFIDTETTGLDPDIHPIWEIAVIVDNVEHVWQQCLSADALADADPYAAQLTKFDERYDVDSALTREESMIHFCELVGGRHLVGAVPSFDEERLRRQYVELFEFPGRFPWHYHLIDVEALAVGFLSARYPRWSPNLPWKSHDLSARFGIVTPKEDEHTALGDARWAKRMYEEIVR